MRACFSLRVLPSLVVPLPLDSQSSWKSCQQSPSPAALRPLSPQPAPSGLCHCSLHSLFQSDLPRTPMINQVATFQSSAISPYLSYSDNCLVSFVSSLFSNKPLTRTFNRKWPGVLFTSYSIAFV